MPSAASNPPSSYIGKNADKMIQVMRKLYMDLRGERFRLLRDK